MKSYAYLREHVRSVLALQDTNDSLGHLAYFMFAPTLVYQDRYERYRYNTQRKIKTSSNTQENNQLRIMP